MEDRKGFTLVELLAVIVILAIIMLIAIPAVLNTLDAARKKAFMEYIDKVALATQNRYMEASLNNESFSSNVVYDVTKDLGLSDVGDFKGYSLINIGLNDLYITLYNDNFAVYGLHYGTIDESLIKKEGVYTDEDLSMQSLVKASGVGDYSYYENGVINNDNVEITKAVLNTGETVNLILKRFADPSASSATEAVGGIKHIVYTQDLTTALDNKVLISDSSSEEPVYAWYNSSSQTVTIGCKNNKVFLNPKAKRLFYNFTEVEDIDLSHFDTSDCTTMHGLFGWSANIKSLDVRHFKTSKVSSFRCMFQGLSHITSLDISNFDLSNAEDLSFFFQGCLNLTSVDTTVFNSKIVKDVESMFNGTDLTLIDLRNLGTSKVTNFSKMFYNCKYVTKIIVSSSFTFNSMTSDDEMFYNCKKLTGFNSEHINSTYASNYLTYA